MRREGRKRGREERGEEEREEGGEEEREERGRSRNRGPRNKNKIKYIVPTKSITHL